MTQRIVECVPNFSEGRDMARMRQITDAFTARFVKRHDITVNVFTLRHFEHAPAREGGFFKVPRIIE